MPNGDVYTCEKCEQKVQIQISFGNPLPNQIKEEDFIKLFDSENKRKKFAESIIEGSIPVKGSFYIDVYHSDITEIGGIKAIQFGATVEFGDTLTYDLTMIGIYKNRFAKITLNYFNGALNGNAKQEIDKLFSSIKFE